MTCSDCAYYSENVESRKFRAYGHCYCPTPDMPLCIRRIERKEVYGDEIGCPFWLAEKDRPAWVPIKDRTGAPDVAN